MKEHLFIVRGRVQGVGFRFFVVREASYLSVTGWVRNNCADGSVEVCVAGEPDACSQLKDKIKQGPPSSWVDCVEEIDDTSSYPVPCSPFRQLEDRLNYNNKRKNAPK